MVRGDRVRTLSKDLLKQLPEQAVKKAVAVIDRFYAPGPLRDLLLTHSALVASKALECMRKRKTDADTEFTIEAALLHDIGIKECDAKDILCFGTEPYIRHGIIGRGMLESIGLPRHALVCERHTGAGLSTEDIVRQNLPLPHRDMLPASVEERLICYADKFFSKSGDITEEKTIERVARSMKRHGADTLNRFMNLHKEFGYQYISESP